MTKSKTIADSDLRVCVTFRDSYYRRAKPVDISEDHARGFCGRHEAGCPACLSDKRWVVVRVDDACPPNGKVEDFLSSALLAEAAGWRDLRAAAIAAGRNAKDGDIVPHPVKFVPNERSRKWQEWDDAFRAALGERNRGQGKDRLHYMVDGRVAKWRDIESGKVAV